MRVRVGVKMINYFIGALILLILVPLYQLFGMSITKTNEKHTYSFVVGFFAYTAIAAVIGIIIQVLDIKWIVFLGAMIAMWLAIIGFIGWSIKEKRIVINKAFFISYFKTEVVLVLCAIVILFFSLQFPNYFWSNNLTDGGFYINRMANLPYIENALTTDVITGLPMALRFSYAINTFEIEASVYIYLSGISATVFARFFLSLLNIYVFLNIYSLFCDIVFKKWKLKNKSIIFPCFGVCIYLLFCICGSTFIPNFYEGWRLRSAIYFGSTFCMAIAPFALAIPILDKSIKGLKEVIWIAVACLVLISRSSVCLPVIVVFALVYFFYQILLLNKQWKIKAGLIAGYVAILSIVAFALSKANLVPFSNDMFFDTLNVPLSYFAFIVSAVGAYFIDNKKISLFIWSLLGGILVLNLVPGLNGIIYLASQHDFVYQRMMITLFIFVYFLAFAFAFYFAIKYIKNNIARITLSIASLAICFYSTCNILDITPRTIRNTFAIYKHNIELIPWTTTALGNELENYYEETGTTLYAMIPNGLILDGYGHIISSIVRYNSPHTISVSGTLRIRDKYTYEGSPFNGFDLEDQGKVETLTNESDEASIEQAREVLDEYPFNCIVLVGTAEDTSKTMEKLGFYPVGNVDNVYVIYVK